MTDWDKFAKVALTPVAPATKDPKRCVLVGLERSGGRFLVRSGYDRPFVEDLKRSLNDRTWSQRHRVWAVSTREWVPLWECLERHYEADNILFTPTAEAKRAELVEDSVIEDARDRELLQELALHVILEIRVGARASVVHAAFTALWAETLDEREYPDHWPGCACFGCWTDERRDLIRAYAWLCGRRGVTCTDRSRGFEYRPNYYERRRSKRLQGRYKEHVPLATIVEVLQGLNHAEIV